MQKNIFRQSFFWTSICCLLAMGTLISLYAYGWVAPTGTPNPSAGSAINFNNNKVGIGTATPGAKLEVKGLTSDNTDSALSILNSIGDSLFFARNDGNVGIGTASPGTKLEVAGQVKITGGTPGADKVLTSDANGLASWAAPSSGGACVVSGNKIICSGIPANSNGSLSITKNGVTCPIWKDCDGDGKTYGNGDCDESCATCYVGSTNGTSSPDGLDQDCDGTIDESGAILLVYMSPTTYNGALGGRTGADSKCDLGTTLGCTINRALISISSTDEIQDMPTNYGIPTDTPIYWYNRTTGTSTYLVGNNWADILDGSIANSQSTGTGIADPTWTGSTSAGAFQSSYNCTNWTYTGYSYSGEYGIATSITSTWLASNMTYCTSAYRVKCLCVQSNYQ